MKQILSIGSSKLNKEAIVYLKLLNFKEYTTKYTNADLNEEKIKILLEDLKHQNYGAIVLNGVLDNHPNLMQRIANCLKESDKENTSIVHISKTNIANQYIPNNYKNWVSLKV